MACPCLSFLGLLIILLATSYCAGEPSAPWDGPALEDTPPVTVRWEDPAQSEVFIVEGERYQARVATWPARLLTLRVDGRDLLGPDGMSVSVVGKDGQRYSVAPRGAVPPWQTWQGQDYKPANSSRARMNVWSAGPYYWDAHLIDIPLMSQEQLGKLTTSPDRPALASWDFADDLQGWQALHSSEMTHDPKGFARMTLSGEDPYVMAPIVDIPGQVEVSLRMRTRNGGGAALYWYCKGEPGFSGEHVRTFGAVGDGDWHVYKVALDVHEALAGLRFDPPGSSGVVDVDWVRIDRQEPPDDSLQPIRGHLVFHAQPDQLRVELRIDEEADPRLPTRAIVNAPGASGEPSDLSGRILLNLGGSRPVAALLCPAESSLDPATGGLASEFAAGARSVCWVLKLPAEQQNLADLFRDDLDPLPPAAFDVTDGYALGYDYNAGFYSFLTSANRGAFSFEASYKNPSRRIETGVSVANDQYPRRVLCKFITGVGNLEAAVVTDRFGFPLPTPAFVCKNFGGEREEPDDSAFGDSYVPLNLAPGEERDFQVLHLLQDWGNHPLKQVSSIRFFHIYWHLSTGAHETTCFTHNWMRHGSGIFQIPDFRPMSGEMWSGQPQHGVGQWPGFLQYNNSDVKLVYERTIFQSISPTLARFSMLYHTSDNTATGRVDVMEVPQRDELRTFLNFRYDWHAPAIIEGDARLNFRWFNVNERQGADTVIWTDAGGNWQSKPVSGDEPELLGELLTDDCPVVAAHGKGEGEDYHSLVLVRGFKARLGGVRMDRTAASAVLSERNGDYWFTVPQEKLELQPGDFVEAQVIVMPHGDPVPPLVKPERERERFGNPGATVDVTVGKKLADFPATVRAVDETAQLTLRGGFDLMPLIVEGFEGYGVPLLWRDGVWQDQQVHGGDGYQVERDGKGGYRFVFAYATRKGQEQNLEVTRAWCTAGISRVYDHNGMLAMQAPAVGHWTVKAPCILAPGTNRCSAESPFVAFSGSAEAVRQVPVSVTCKRGQPSAVTIARWSPDVVELSKSGGEADIVFHQLLPGGRYELTVNGTAREAGVSGESLAVTLPVGDGAVTLRRL